MNRWMDYSSLNNSFLFIKIYKSFQLKKLFKLTPLQQIISGNLMDREKIKQFQEGLPIREYREKIQKSVSQNNFCIVTGDTGSGKSTQLPQYMMDSAKIRQSIIASQSNVDEYKNGSAAPINEINVIITQPRRMAAVSMANRVSYERGIAQVGKQVGYTIRFDDKTSKNTRLRYITDGIFVRQCINDPYLFKYHVVILDEAHERSLYTDILFALVKKAVLYRKGTLKLLVTSATLNTKTFSNYYGGCPVIQMHGKLYPVQVKFFPIKQSSRVEESVKAAIRMHLHQGPGDILVFLTGSQECQSATRLCQQKLQVLMSKGKDVPGMIMYQLYGALSNQDQARVFQKTPQGIRKVVFCTNIAETSLTIDNIGFVIDCGYVKQKNYNPKTNMDSLVTIPISKVQAIQRKGRAGRTQQGKCLRLYSEKFYQEIRDFSLPQILRVSLSNVILTLKSMRVHDVVNFQYMQNPDKQAIFKALGDLFLLGALNQDGQIQELGNQMSKFPLEPQFSKALITGALFQCQDQMITLVSMLSTESIFKKVLRINQEEYEQFLASQKKFLAKTGDHQTLLNVYQGWIKCQDPDKFCDQNFLNFRALKQSDNIKNQLYQILNTCNLQVCKKYFKNDSNYSQFLQIKEYYKGKLPEDYVKTLLRRSLSLSFYYNTARLTANEQAYILNYPEGTIVGIDPTSALARQNIISPTLLFTQLGSGGTRGIMRSISIVDHKWIAKYLPKTKEIDYFRLAGMKLQRLSVIEVKQQESQQDKKKRLLQERQKKIKQAKQRYQVRKKVKLN